MPNDHSFLDDVSLDDDHSFLDDVQIEKKQPERTLGGTLGDIGVTGLKGAVGLVESGIGLADLATGGYAGKLAEDVGLRTKDTQKILDDSYSPAQQFANKQMEEAEGFTGSIGTALEYPSNILTGIGESLPSMLGGGVVGGVASKAGKVSQAVGAAIGEGVVGAGSSAEGIRQQTDDGLLTGKQTGLAALTGVGTAAFGYGGSKLAQYLKIGDIDTALTGRVANQLGGETAEQQANIGIAKRIIGGGISEGLFEEMPQSIQETVLQNAALDKPLLEGVPESAAMGLITGGVMGAGFNAIPNTQEKPKGVLGRAADKAPSLNNAPPTLGNIPINNDIAPSNELDATKSNELLNQANGVNYQEAIDNQFKNNEPYSPLAGAWEAPTAKEQFTTPTYKDIPNTERSNDIDAAFASMDNVPSKQEQIDQSFTRRQAENELKRQQLENSVEAGTALTGAEIKRQQKQLRKFMVKERITNDNRKAFIENLGFEIKVNTDESAQTESSESDFASKLQRALDITKAPEQGVQLTEVLNESMEGSPSIQGETKQSIKSNGVAISQENTQLYEDEVGERYTSLGNGDYQDANGETRAFDEGELTLIGEEITPIENNETTISETNTESDISKEDLTKKPIEGQLQNEQKITQSQEAPIETQSGEKLNEVGNKAQDVAQGEVAAAKENEPSIETDGAVSDPILTKAKNSYVKGKLKEQQIKPKSPGFADAKARIEEQYEDDLLQAEASLPYEKFRERSLKINPNESESLTKQSYIGLREEFGITNQEAKAPETPNLNVDSAQNMQNTGLNEAESANKDVISADESKPDQEAKTQGTDAGTDSKANGVVEASSKEQSTVSGEEKVEYHPAIESMANELTEGGGVSYTKDEHGKITGRTPSANPDWFKDKAFVVKKANGDDYASTPSVKEIRSAVDKHNNGEKLTAKQKGILNTLSEVAKAEEEFHNQKFSEEQADFARDLNALVISGQGTGIESYLDDAIKGGRVKSYDDILEWQGDINDVKREASKASVSNDKETAPEGLESYDQRELNEREEEQRQREKDTAERELKADNKAKADAEVDSVFDNIDGSNPDTSDVFGGNAGITVKDDKPKQNLDKLKDFGEVLDGAKKHTYVFTKALDDDIDVKTVPLSKSIPAPNYEKMISDGVDPVLVATIAQLRTEIKPRMPKRGASRWADEVNGARNKIKGLMKGILKPEEIYQSANTAIASLGNRYDVAQLANDILPSQVKELAKFTLSKTKFAVYNDEKNVTKWAAEKVGSKGNSSGWSRGGDTEYFDTKQEALDYIKSRVADTNAKTGKAQTKFDIWTERGKPGVFLGKKVASRKYIQLKKFDNAKEARAYKDDNYDELIELLAKKKKVRAIRRIDNNPRVGTDYRNEKDVTPELFQDTFGFRGVQFGNYVEGTRRQQDLNNAYDGLLDLADTLNMPPKALSLNGTLGLAFGARGSGGKNPAAAHYESGGVNINLTKLNGKGSLAHELFHAIDNYFGNMDEGEAFLTEGNRKKRKVVQKDGIPTMVKTVDADFKVRKEVYDAWKGLHKAIKNETKLIERSEELDNKRGKDYWSTVREMTARTFERYVIDKLASKGFESDYLANVVSEEAHNAENAILGDDQAYPYPLNDEMEAVNKAYDTLFKTLKTKKTDKGTALYSKQTKPTQKSTVAQVKALLPRRVQKLVDNGKLKVVQSVSDLPKNLREAGNALYQAAFHGSPHDHDKFSTDKIGTGEGVQAYGYGLYFAGSKKVAEWYREALSSSENVQKINGIKIADIEQIRGNWYSKDMLDEYIETYDDFDSFMEWKEDVLSTIDFDINNWKENKERQNDTIKFRGYIESLDSLDADYSAGHMYEVELAPKDDEYLLWDKPLSEQSEFVINALEKKFSLASFNEDFHSAGEFHKSRIRKFDNQEKASKEMHDLGIRGVKYLDGSSRDAGEGNYNYVIFNDDDVSITAKYSQDLSGVEALYDTKTDTTYLIADALDKENVNATLAHELFHRARATDKKLQTQLSKLDQRLKVRFDLATKGKGTKAEIAAYERVMEAETNPADQLEEFQAYMVTAYNENPKSLSETMRKWVKDLIATIRAALIRQGIAPKNITPADLSALAKYGAKEVRESFPSSNVVAKASKEGYYGDNPSEASEWLKAKAKGLDMSHKARMERAETMGFDVDTTYIHESPETKLTEINKRGRFGGAIFALPSDSDKAKYYDNEHELIIKGEVADNDDLSSYVYDNYLEAKSFIGYEFDGVVDSDNEGSIFAVITDEDFTLNEELASDFFGSGFDDSLFYENAQRLRGELAILAGFNAVQTNDEFAGDTVMLLSGNGVRSIHAAFDPDNADSGKLLASKAPKYSKTSEAINTLSESESAEQIKTAIKRTKTGAKGNEKSLPVSEVKKITDKFIKDFNGNIPLNFAIFPTAEKAFKDGAERKDEGIKGAYYSKDGAVVLVAENLFSKKDIESTIRHEVLAHYGVNTFLKGDKRAILDKIIASENHAGLKHIWADIRKIYTDVNDDLLAEEVLARIAEEDRSVAEKFIDRLMAVIHKALRKVGLIKAPVSRSELRSMIAGIGKGIKDGTLKQQNFPKENDTLFSKSSGKSSWKGKKGFDDVNDATFDTLGKVGKPLDSGLKDKAKSAFEEHKYLWRNKLRQGVVDQYDSFNSVLDDKKAWMMANLSNTGGAVAEAALEFGQPFMDKSGAVDINTDKKSLSKIVEPLGEELDRFLMWIAGNRAEGLKLDGKENLFSDDDIANLKGLSEGDMDGKNRKVLYNKVRIEFEAMHNAIVKMGVDTGLVSNEDAKLWKEQGFYVPFYRLADESANKTGPVSVSGLARQQAYKKLKGADMQLDDLLGNTLMNWNHLIGASLKNQSAAQALKSAEAMGLAKSIPGSLKGKNSIFVRADGKEQWYNIDESQEGALVLDSLTALNYDGLNSLGMKVMRKFKRALTIGVTASPEFKIANLMRDSIQAVAVADMSTNIAKNLYDGFKATKKDSKTIAQMIAGGGAFGDSGYIHGGDPDAIKIVLEKGIERSTILDSRKGWKKLWDKYQDVGARLENVNRAANFEQSLAKGDDLLTANFSARDHLDFARTGSFVAVRALSQMVPFLNARLQGLDKLGRSVADKNQRKQFATVVGSYALMSVALYLSMKDDDDFKEAEQWERDTYHLFKLPGSDVMYRIPRPFEVGALANIAERAAEQLVDDSVHGELFAERLWHSISETFAMNPTPQLFRPIIETWANKSFFTGRGIESQAMQRMSKVERKKAWTSQTAIGVSQAMDSILWDEVTLSPVQVEHIVNGYLGWAGATALSVMDATATSLLDTPPKPEMRIEDYPVIGRFVREGKGRGSRFVTEFYEQKKAIDQHVADIKRYRDDQDYDKHQAALKEYKDDTRYRKLYSRTGREISKINKQIRLITSNKAMSSAAKRKRIDKLNARRSDLAKRAVERYAA